MLATALLAFPDLLSPQSPTTPPGRRLVEVVAARDAHGTAYPVTDPRLLAAFARRVPILRRAGSVNDGDPDPSEVARQMAEDLAVAVYQVADLLTDLAAESDSDLAHSHPTQPRLAYLDLAATAHPAAATDDSPPAATAPVEVTHVGTGWVMVRDSRMGGFEPAYAQEYTRVVLWSALSDGSTAYTVARRSDLVEDFPVGPAEQPGTILAALAAREPGWGGGSSIGGAPRHRDRSRSTLRPDEIFTIIEAAVSPTVHAG
ncbi:hypothetical protein I6A60_05950 [Frankia sp. AgB1.9]|uniref:hypothetical protein n=1 Tax=unclassified Frankia TaxID=2632575 RepID=UPI001932C866|nr:MULTISPECIES: hypothetical protein [unclassified Frankia]MBL7487461.1 hypothetical protein [Frankia sp. AgW1.1]MBL7547423.1 hypothetical protein [Frankia sp. AgB1.9]MBL7618802.1 hypothetical protein [Frankia sp. AgB1.8]